MSLILVLLGGAIGAPSRYLIGHLVYNRLNWTSFPTGTLFVNLTGAFALGWITGSFAHHDISNNWRLLLGIGFCGAYTTFSTFAFETVHIWQEGSRMQSVINVILTAGGGCVVAALGLFAGSLR